MNSLSLNQRSSLSQIIHRRLPDLNTELVWKLTEEITDKQYMFLWAIKGNENFPQKIDEIIEFYNIKQQENVPRSQ